MSTPGLVAQREGTVARASHFPEPATANQFIVYYDRERTTPHAHRCRPLSAAGERRAPARRRRVHRREDAERAR